MQNKKIKNDIILIISVLISSALIFILIGIFSTKGNYVSIEQNSKQIALIDINHNQEYNLYNKSGKVCNTVLIKDGYVSMKYADCKDKICVNHNKISKNNESIICLPNKVIVTVSGSNKNEVDGVAK